MRGWSWAIASIMLAFAPAAARASGDYACTPSWRLAHPALEGCSDMAPLSPGNDTRSNLLLLLIDRHGLPGGGLAGSPVPLVDWPGLRDAFRPPRPPARAGDDAVYMDGEGSRCRGDAAGRAAFEAALAAASGPPPAERTALVAARRGLKPDCSGKPAGPVARIEARSPAGREFARYLDGARAFYAGDFAAASTTFAALRGARDPWLSDTAAYMAARVEVNRMQAGLFDEYGTFREGARVDPRVAASAEAMLRGYVGERPRGRYVASARGLIRRVHWIAGNVRALAADYAALLALPPAARGIDDADLIEEIDGKLLARLTFRETRDPTLLAILDLRAMRAKGRDDYGGQAAVPDPPLALAALEAQRAAFADEPALFDLLLATHAFYVEHAPAKVLRLLPDETGKRGAGTLAFSRRMLRGMALEATGDREARAYWLAMLPGATWPLQRGAVELGLAMHDERHGALARLFEPGSPVRTPAIRILLVDNVADAKLLRQLAKGGAASPLERDHALYALLYKEVTRGRYRDFAGDVALSPPHAPVETGYAEMSYDARPAIGIFTSTGRLGDFGCPTLPETAARLAKRPDADAPRLCLADFVRANGLDGDPLDTRPPEDELGGTPSPFPGPAYARFPTYRAIIANARAAPADRAYALYRAVNCYAPSGTNQCGREDVPKATRKAWFTELKSAYPTSRWARSLAYWW